MDKWREGGATMQANLTAVGNFGSQHSASFKLIQRKLQVTAQRFTATNGTPPHLRTATFYCAGKLERKKIGVT